MSANMASNNGTRHGAKPPSKAIVDVGTRRTVLILFCAAFVVGLPYWWMSTAIERLSLPNNRVHAWSARQPCILRPRVSLNVRAEDAIGSKAVDMARQAVFTQLGRSPGAECLDIVDQLHEDGYEIVLSASGTSPSFSGRTATVPISPELGGPASVLAATTLLGLAPAESDVRVVKFAPRYKVFFSLLNQDSTQQGPLLTWDAQKLVTNYIRPLMSSLSAVHDFSVDTSIQYFAPLAVPLARDEHTNGTLVQEADLKAFVNAAEWQLPTSNTLDPVLHFMLYVPSSNNRPMRINTHKPGASTTSFITPQRGGVVIYNPPPDGTEDLSQPFATFHRQLARILGVPVSPSRPARLRPEPWQVDILVRRRLAEASRDTVETLDAIIKLVAQIPNMRVGTDVKTGVNAALAELDAAQDALASSSDAALAHVSRASTLASKAYFDPSMLALLYFPDEHKYAIHTPLFGPVLVPILVGIVRELKERRERRRKALATKKDDKVE